jgi:aquaporin Z
LPAKEVPGYLAGQFLGGICGAAVLAVIAGGTAKGLGQNGFGAHSPMGFSLTSGVVFEFVATLLFLVAILGATGKRGTTPVAGLAIGLTLVVIHIVGIPVTGVSVNPARSLGPALLVGSTALAQVWMFLIVPSAGGLVGGLLFRAKVLED